MNEKEIKRRLIEGITDTYTLNLAISILEELQAYKDKEDKLREYITNKTHFMTENGIQYMCNSDELLQILNEGE